MYLGYSCQYTVYMYMYVTLTIADTAPSFCRYSTILLLCAGSTREKSRALIQAFLCSSSDIASNSRPENDFPVEGVCICVIKREHSYSAYTVHVHVL